MLVCALCPRSCLKSNQQLIADSGLDSGLGCPTPFTPYFFLETETGVHQRLYFEYLKSRPLVVAQTVAHRLVHELP